MTIIAVWGAGAEGQGVASGSVFAMVREEIFDSMEITATMTSDQLIMLIVLLIPGLLLSALVMGSFAKGG